MRRTPEGAMHPQLFNPALVWFVLAALINFMSLGVAPNAAAVDGVCVEGVGPSGERMPCDSSSRPDTDRGGVRAAKDTSVAQSFLLWPIHLFVAIVALPFCAVTLNTGCVERVLKNSVDYSPPARLAAAMNSRNSSKGTTATPPTEETTTDGAAGTVPGRESTAVFGVPSNPSGVQLSPVDSDRTVTAADASAQADSAKQSGAVAATAGPPEIAKHAAECQFDRSGCSEATSLPRLTVSGKPSVQAAVFPGMSKDEWSRLESTDRGRDLIAYAGKLVDQQT